MEREGREGEGGKRGGGQENEEVMTEGLVLAHSNSPMDLSSTCRFFFFYKFLFSFLPF